MNILQYYWGTTNSVFYVELRQNKITADKVDATLISKEVNGDLKIPIKLYQREQGVYRSDPLIAVDREALPSEQMTFAPNGLTIRAQSVVKTLDAGDEALSIDSLPAFKKARVEVFVRDDKGNAVGGATVYFKSNDPGVLLPEAKQTNSIGKVEAYIRANIAGTKTITIGAEWYENAKLIIREGTARIFFIPQVTPIITEAGKELIASFTSGEKVLQTKGVVLGIKIRAKPQEESAPRPLEYAIIKGTKPLIEFEFIPSIDVFISEKVETPYYDIGFVPVIILDDGDDETSIDRSLDLSKRYINIDLTGTRFTRSGNLVYWSLAAEPDELIKLGTNRIKVVAASKDPGAPSTFFDIPTTAGPVICEANFLVYKEPVRDADGEIIKALDAIPETFSSRDRVEIVRLPSKLEEGKFITIDAVLGRFRIYFLTDDLTTPENERLTDIQISDFLRNNRLQPNAMLRRIGLISARLIPPLDSQQHPSYLEEIRAKPEVERAFLVPVVETLLSQFNGKGVEIKDAFDKPLFRPSRVPVVDPDYLRQAAGKSPSIQASLINPYEITLNFVATNTIEATVTRNRNGTGSSLVLYQDAVNQDIFRDAEGRLTLVLLNPPLFNSIEQEFIQVSLTTNNLLGCSVTDSREYLLEANSNSLIYHSMNDTLVQVGFSMVPSLGIIDKLVFRVERQDQAFITVELTETGTNSWIFRNTTGEQEVQVLSTELDPAIEPFDPVFRNNILALITSKNLRMEARTLVLEETSENSLIFVNSFVREEEVITGGPDKVLMPEVLEQVLKTGKFFIRSLSSAEIKLELITAEDKVESSIFIPMKPYVHGSFISNKPLLRTRTDVPLEPDVLSFLRTNFIIAESTDLVSRFKLLFFFGGSLLNQEAKDKVVAALGNSLPAGFQHAILHRDFQQHSIPSVVARALGVQIVQPLIDPAAPFPIFKLNEREGNKNHKLDLGDVDNAKRIQFSQSERTEPDAKPQNLGIPGALTTELINVKTSKDAKRLGGTGFENKFFDLILQGGVDPKGELKGPALQQLKELDPSPNVVLFWPGNTDAVGAINAANTTELVKTSDFKSAVNTILRELIELREKLEKDDEAFNLDILMANVPDVTKLPSLFEVDKKIGPLPFAVIGRGKDPVFGIEVAKNVTSDIENLVIPRGNLDAGTKLPLTKLPSVIKQEGFSVAFISGRPDSNDTLSPAELDQIRKAVTDYNTIIIEEATNFSKDQPLIPVVDIHKLFIDAANAGLTVPGTRTKLTTSYTGGIFGLDGIHPNTITYGFIADEFLKVIDKEIKERKKKKEDASFGGFTGINDATPTDNDKTFLDLKKAFDAEIVKPLKSQ